jgi:hypothetical protein
MSEILSNIVVEQTNINFSPDNNNLNITPEAIQLNIFTGASPGAGQSNNGELLYNNVNLIDGVPNTSFASGNLTLGNVANIKITGGTNGYVLQTDGAGNLDWTVMTAGLGNSTSGQLLFNNSGNVGGVSNTTVSSGTLTFTNLSNLKINGGTNGYVLQTDGLGNLGWTASGGGGNGSPGGANTQIQFNDSGLFGGRNFFTFNKTTGDVVVPNDLYLGSGFPLVGGNISGKLANFTGNITGANFIGSVRANGLVMLGSSVAQFPTVNSIQIGGGLANYILKTDGTGNLSWVSEANNAVTVTGNAQPNITSVGTLTSLAISGNITAGNANVTGYISTISTTVNALIAANSVNSGTRAFVTDGNTTTFYSVIGSGGSNGVPVFSDGTNWRVG